MLLDRGFVQGAPMSSSENPGMDQYRLAAGDAEIVVRVRRGGFRYVHVIFDYPGIKENVSSASYPSVAEFLAKTDELAGLMRVAQQLSGR